MLPGFHGFDLIIILALALLILGPKKLPEVGSAIGKSIREYHKGMKEVSAPEGEGVQALTAASEVPAQNATTAKTSQASVQSQERKE